MIGNNQGRSITDQHNTNNVNQTYSSEGDAKHSRPMPTTNA